MQVLLSLDGFTSALREACNKMENKQNLPSYIDLLNQMAAARYQKLEYKVHAILE